MVLLLGGLTIHRLVRRRSAAVLAWAVIPFVVGAALWLLPTMNAVGGLPAYVVQVREHVEGVTRTDSIASTGFRLLEALRARSLELGHTFLLHTAGFDPLGQWPLPDILRAVATAAVVVPGLVWAGWRRRETRLLACWLALAWAQLFFLSVLDRPRLIVPLLPPLALLIGSGWARLTRRRVYSVIVLGGAAVALLLYTMPIAARLASVPAPHAQAAAYVTENHSPDETLLAAAGAFRAAQVDLPDYRLLFLYVFDSDAAWEATSSGQVRYVVVFDRDVFADDAMAALSGGGAYVPVVDTTFTRSPLVHTQHADLRVQVLMPADQVPPEAVTLPAGDCIDIGGVDDGKYLLRGWYRGEDVGGVSGRWAGDTQTAIRVYLGESHDYRLTVRALAYPAEQELTIRVGGRDLGQVDLSQGWEEHSVVVPTDLVPGGEVIEIELVHSRTASPYTETGGETTDRRQLAAAYDWICLVAVPAD
ncbi:MAG: hypothetical protein E3J64_08615 [Anaerolineales bacterium]|nr:MAG: hypothetical protein E3J64_08615 [Anaerolineales bacterium]